MGGIWDGIAGAAAGALGSIFGQQSANEANKEIASNANQMSQANAREQMAFQQKSLDQQQAFQERMANSVYQRAAEDMKKAGLNPMLAASNAAPSPSGGAAPGAAGEVQSPRMENVFKASDLAAMVNMTLQALNTNANIEVANAQAANLKASTSKIGVDTDVARRGIPEAEMKNQGYRIIKPLLDRTEKALKTNSFSLPKGTWQERRKQYQDKLEQQLKQKRKVLP